MNKKRGYQPKPRNTYHRERKAVVLLATEGKNKTETLYFKSIPSSTHVIKFAPGNYTDPVNMVQALKREYVYYELDQQLGDTAYCLVDTDVHSGKDKQLAKADAVAGNSVRVIVSSPCFEVWYICHFTSSAKHYASSDDAVKTLQKYLPNYSKAMPDIWSKLSDRTETAIANAIDLEKKCFDAGHEKHTEAFAPSTEVYEIINLLLDCVHSNPL